MRRKHLKGIMSILLIVVFAVVLYGCGGGGSIVSGSGRVSEKTLPLAYDTDNDGTPDIFDDYPDDGSRSVYPTCVEADYSTTHDSMETAIGKGAPYSAPTTFKGSIDSANGTDYYAVSLEAGKTYSLVFYDPQKMDGRAVTFDPNVSIYTGHVSFLTSSIIHDPTEDEEPLQGLSSPVIDGYEQLPLELSSAGESHVIIISFTALENRVHYIAVRSSVDVDAGGGYPYRFDLIEDHDKDGMRIKYKAPGGGNNTYSHEDILLIKSSMKPYVTEWASDGSPKKFSDGAKTAYTATVNYLAMVQAEDSDKTSLEPLVADIPWDSRYKFGYGIDATTGLPASQLQAISSFTPPVPDKPVTKTDTTIYFVNSDEQYAKEIQAGGNTKFGCFGVTFKASGSYTENIRYSENETTLILKFFIRETEYRTFDPAGGAYTLIDSAKTYLSKNKDDFRNKYGDYFIAGARYGAEYIAALHIKASSAEQIKKIETQLSQESKKFDFMADETFKASFFNATKNCEVKVIRTTIGGDSTQLSAGTSAEQMFDDLKIFIKTCTKDNRAPLEAYMFRFNQMPDGSSIASEINISPTIFSKERDLSKNYLALSSRARIIAGSDDNTFQAGVKNDYQQEYETLTNEIKDNRETIFKDKNILDSYVAKVKAALDKYSNLIDRQSFFLKLVELQKKWPNHTEHKNRESGFKTYYLSRTVNNDISKPSLSNTYNVDHHESGHVGWRYWYPEWTPGSNSIVCYIKIDVDSSTSYDDCWDTNYPSLGRDRLSFKFQSGYDRKGSWWLKAKDIMVVS